MAVFFFFAIKTHLFIVSEYDPEVHTPGTSEILSVCATSEKAINFAAEWGNIDREVMRRDWTDSTISCAWESKQSKIHYFITKHCVLT